MEHETTSRSRFPDSCSSPLLVFAHGKKKSQTLYSLSKKRPYVRSIRELRHSYYCWPIAQGGLLLWDPDLKKRFLLNPATMTNVEMPQLKCDPSGNYQYLASASVGDNNCVVLCSDSSSRRMFFWRLGAANWVKYDYSVGDDILDDAVACHGKFYGRTSQGTFVSIEIDPRPMLKVLTSHRLQLPVGLEFSREFLLESCGQIYRVSTFLGTSMKVVHVSVANFNFSKKEWEWVESIGADRIFFLGSYGFAASWSASEMDSKGDCIHFLNWEDKCLHTVDMEDGTLSTALPCPNLPTPWSTPYWIMPSCRV